MLLHHITLPTGDCVAHRLDLLDPHAVAACRALLPAGGPVPAFPAFHVEVVAAVFTVFRGRDPLVSCGVTYGEDDTWKALSTLQARFCPVKAASRPGQCLAVALLPALSATARNDIGWLADFERCMAAALLASGAHR